MKKEDIIITGIQSWDIKIGSNCKNIAKELAKNNRVLYVNPPNNRKHSIAKYLKNINQSQELKQVKNNLWVYNPPSLIESISRLPVNFVFDILNHRNNKNFANDILKAIDKLQFKKYIHFCDSDMFRSLHLKELLNPALSVYYTRDNLLAVKYWQTQGRRIEPLHMKKADLVVANSSHLAKLASKYNSNSFFIGQGCDVSAFTVDANSLSTPSDVQSIKSPIIGYIGALNTLRLDISVIEYISQAKPNWNIVLVGPEDDNFKNSSLHNIQNIYFLGSKTENELPSYLNTFDIAINPQIVNEVTIGNYPRKIDEYLAMGKPVVATETEAMKYFEQYVSLASNKEEWINKIEKELNNNSVSKSKKRIDFAKIHSWENCINELAKNIKKIKK